MNSLPIFLIVDSTTCDILRLTVNPDHDMGSLAGAYEEIATGVVCALDRSMSINRQYGGGRESSLQGETDHQSYKLFLCPTQSILTGDKVIVGTAEYKVTDVISFSSHKEVVLSLC